MATTKTSPKSPKKAKAAPTVKADSKFAEFLKTKKLDVRRVMGASHTLESLHREDRSIKLVKRQQKKSEEKVENKETRKPRSGRPITDRAMSAALSGGTISGPTKSRILKAVNHLLTQKKQEAVQLKTLF